MQIKGRIIADMHTHSENSHDSVCKIEDMCLSQIAKGTNVMAVTDHCDIFSNGDIFTPIKASVDTVNKLKAKYSDKLLLLSGIEIGEGFWEPDRLNKALYLCDYDVVLGSVHCVKYNDTTAPYSKIDFSKYSQKEIYAYLDAYFDDVLTLINTTDFDILSHLTCPLRYITGKQGILIDLGKFTDKTDRILQLIINKGIALEVNTTSYITNDYLPNVDIIKRYYHMGGYLITLGSDAHTVQNASINFIKAISTLKEIGFKNLYYYKERKPVPYEI